MHLRSVSFIVVPLALITIGAHSVRAADTAKPDVSTIRIVFAPSAEPPAAQEADPPRIVVPPQPPEPSSEARIEQPELMRVRPVAEVPTAPPATPFPVRQAIHAAASPAPTRAPAPTTGRTPSVVNVYARPTAQATLTKMPRPMAVQPRPKTPASRPRGKPFQSVPSEPTISPYLNMYRRDVDANNLPNYFAFVRPQLEQQEANRQQAAELQKLRGQLQNLGSASGPPTSANMTAHARYMDTAQFYGGITR